MTNQTDDSWRKKLSTEAYAALREGVFEEPHAGLYVKNKATGMFVCGACGAPLFSSDERIDDGSGYVAFRAPVDVESVVVSRHYHTDGSEYTAIRCASCQSMVGRMSDVEIRSASDLESGERQHTYRISSRAVRLQKNITPRNYPLLTVVVLLVCVLGAAMLFQKVQHTVRTVSSFGAIASNITLVIGDATIVVPTTVVPPEGLVVKETDLASSSLFVVVSEKGRKITLEGLPRHGVLIWIDSGFRVRRVQPLHETASNYQGNEMPVFALILTDPSLATYGATLKPGTEIVVLNKGELFLQ